MPQLFLEFDQLIEGSKIAPVIIPVIYFITTLLLIYISRMIFKLFNNKININHELVEKDNTSFALKNTGYFIGVLLCAGGTLLGESQGLSSDLLLIASYGLGGIFILNISMYIIDILILNKFKINEEIIEKENTAIGVVIAAFYVAIGLIIQGTIVGEGGNLATTFIIWVTGLILLYLVTLFYDLITPYKIQEHLKKGNLGVGIGYSGAIVAASYLLYFSLQDNFISYFQFGQNILYYSLIGIALLPIIRICTDKILLPGRNLTDEIVNQKKPNIGAAFLEAFSYIGSAILITWCL